MFIRFSVSEPVAYFVLGVGQRSVKVGVDLKMSSNSFENNSNSQWTF